MPVDPPRPRGPSLNALRAFESAARLGGFSKAAEELSLSPGAISQHVKVLEDWAGAPLFTRHAQGLTLTEVGEAVLTPLTRAFDQVGEAVQSLRAHARPEALHIAALPAVAQLWLGPILPELRAAMPGQEISVSALETPPNLAREAYDMALFYGTEGGEVIEEDEIFPVCAPHLAAAVTRIEDLAILPCLHDSTWAGDWRLWALIAGLPRGISLQGPSFSLYALAVEEALSGAGVLIAHGALVRSHLDAGTLAQPIGPKVKTGLALRLDLRPGAQTAPLLNLAALLRAKGRGQRDFNHVPE